MPQPVLQSAVALIINAVCNYKGFIKCIGEASTNYSQDNFGSAKTKLNASDRGQPNTCRAALK